MGMNFSYSTNYSITQKEIKHITYKGIAIGIIFVINIEVTILYLRSCYVINLLIN